MLTTTVNAPLPPTAHAWPCGRRRRRAPRESLVERCRRARAAGARRASAASLSLTASRSLDVRSVARGSLRRVRRGARAELGRAAIRDHRLGRNRGAELARTRQSRRSQRAFKIADRNVNRIRRAAASQRSLGRAVGSRMFTPAEYLRRDAPRGRLMSPGKQRARRSKSSIPVPDAYGFELDVCIEVEASSVTCGTDKVFL